MGLSLSEFWAMTPKVFWAYYEGWEKEKERAFNQWALYQRRFTFELARRFGYKSSKHLKQEDLLLFDFEQEEKVKSIPSADELKSRLAAMKSLVQKGKGKKVSGKEFFNV